MAFGYCLCVCVCPCLNHALVPVITCDLFKLGSPNLDILLKSIYTECARHEIWGIKCFCFTYSGFRMYQCRRYTFIIVAHMTFAVANGSSQHNKGAAVSARRERPANIE